MAPFWFLIYDPLGLGGTQTGTLIEGAGFNVLYASCAEPRAQFASVSGGKVLGICK